jgi:hypothetical protein
MAHTVRSEGDITLRANRATGFGEQRDRAAVVLMARLGPEPRPFSRQWLDSLVGRGLADGICAAGDPEECSGEVMTSFLAFSDPQFAGDTLATISVSDRALNPSVCRRHTGSGTGGSMTVLVTLVRKAQEWEILNGQMQEGSTIFC